MKTWLFMLQLIPTITALIKIAEKILGNSEGLKKKEFVKDGVKQLARGLGMVSTGGQKETWKLIESSMEPIGDLIDSIVAFMYPNLEETPKN